MMGNLKSQQNALNGRNQKINLKKSKELSTSRREKSLNIDVGEEKLEQVQEFKFLDVGIKGSAKIYNKQERDIQYNKKNFYRTVYISILIQKSETQLMDIRRQKNIHIKEIMILRRTLERTRQNQKPGNKKNIQHNYNKTKNGRAFKMIWEHEWTRTDNRSRFQK